MEMAYQTTSICKECGWSCKSCTEQTNLHLHLEIENLKQRLLEREHHIVTMETNFLAEAEKFPNGEYAALSEELLMWQDKYSRLYESYKRVQKVNQNLEDKLLKIVDKCETEKNSLLREVATISQQLGDSRVKVSNLQNQNERYRNDVNLAIQLLQCKPNNFVSQRYDSLPADLQQKVLSYIYMCGRRRIPDSNSAPIKLEMKTIKVPIPSSPPTSMVYSVNKNASDSDDSSDDGMEEPQPHVDSVSAAIMAKVLEERQRERQQSKHCENCQCPLSEVTEGHGEHTTNVLVQVDMPCLWCGQCGDLGRTVIEATNRSSQGLVRYVDVIATRTGETVTRSSNLKQVECDTTFAPTSNTGSALNRLGVKINAGKISSTSDVTPIPVSGSRRKNRPVTEAAKNFSIGNSNENLAEAAGSFVGAVNGFATSEQEENDGKSVNGMDGVCKNVYSTKSNPSCVNKNSSSEVKSNSFLISDCNESSQQNHYQSLVKHNLDNSKSVQTTVVGLEVMSNGKSDCVSTFRTKDLTNNDHGDLINKTNAHNLLNSSESIGIKEESWEGRSYINNDQNKLYICEGAKEVNDNEKVVPFSTTEKCVNHVSLPGIVKPTETSISKLPFLNSSKAKERNSEDSVLSRPRLCSMRMQAGSSNILLDNATSYDSVLYTGRPSHQDSSKLWNINSARPGTAVLVHSPRSRSISSTEDPLYKNDLSTSKQGLRQQDAPPETEI